MIRRTYAFAILDDLIPLYALLFSDSGLSTGRISALFVLWSLTAFVLEIPSGALADRVSRRGLLAIGALLRAVGFALWLVEPSFAGFAAGFALWGVQSAFTSGTYEAMIYDGLDAVGAAKLYARVIGRTEVLAMLGVIAGTALAAPLLEVGGHALAGWTSVAICVVGAVVAFALPAPHCRIAPRGAPESNAHENARGSAYDKAPEGMHNPSSASHDTAGMSGYLATLQSGLAEAWSNAMVRRLLVLAALLPGFSALDEYLPLLARSTGASDAVVPLLLVVQYVGLAFGAELAGRHPGVRSSHVALLTAVGAVLLAAGALSGQPIGFLGVGVCYVGLWFGTVVSGARLQERMTGVARATVTSVAGFGSEAGALAVYAGYGIGARWESVPVLTAALALPILLLAAAIPRWLPTPLGRSPDTAEDEGDDEEDEDDGEPALPRPG